MSEAAVMIRFLSRQRETQLLAGCAVLLVPWIVVLALTLPAHTVARNWSVAWSGFDVLLAIMLGATAWLRRTGDPRVGALAGASAAMLVVDAWFDTSTSAIGIDAAMAWASAVFVELPLAFVCARIALRRQR
ncbi:hypothetical protein KDK95_02575 [Actinospica sp. MGRD01-02]|uniref:Uncharacterized protein n=1 Tax=Actinospica acidithermotolerans TaxID=2828514 RepID=A0A941E819_9ACTN|nr:hypothetical protein [Actinospica acidithermotolerans]MBR7825175.1 hypothetical protein [Actinospica acidithermotolerans]